jgi:hypothetical protein
MNLATLTIEGVHDFIVSSVIPRLAAVWKKDQEQDTTDNNHSTTIVTTSRDHQHNINKSFLQAQRLESMSVTTAWRWMRLLGFRYDARRKSFYVNGHERDDVVANRSQFCKTYLTELEPY